MTTVVDGAGRLLERRVGPRRGAPSGIAVGLGRPPEFSHCNQIPITDGANVNGMKRDERLGPPRCEDELHVEPVGLVSVDDGSQVTTAKAMFGQVTGQNDWSQRLEHGTYPGNAVTKRGASSSF